MIEVAVGIARRGQAELDKALDRLTGDLESKLNEMLATGLCSLATRAAGSWPSSASSPPETSCPRQCRPRAPGPSVRPSPCHQLPRTADAPGPNSVRSGCLFRKPRPSEPDDEPGDVEDKVGLQEATAWVVEGIRQLECGGFLDRNQEANIITFHQTLSDYAKRTRLSHRIRTAPHSSGC